MAEGERPRERRPTRHEGGVEVTGRHGNGSNDRVARARQNGFGDVLPPQLTAALERELLQVFVPAIDTATSSHPDAARCVGRITSVAPR
jgi:hypothetical protein